VFHIKEITLFESLEMLHFYHAHILSAIKLKPNTYAAVGNTQLMLISAQDGHLQRMRIPEAAYMYN